LEHNKWALVAGGAGFLGQYVLWGLLRQGYAVVLALSRRNNASITDRMARLRHFNGMVNSAFRVTEDEMRRVVPIESDIRHEGLGLDRATTTWLAGIRLAELWNCAAFMSYDDDSSEESYATNVRGSLNLVAVATQHSSCKYFHVSTAFIGGSRHSSEYRLQEKVYASQDHHFNSYTRTKAQAEQEVCSLCETPAQSYAIFRPTVLIGDSATGFTSSTLGFYQYVEAFDRLTSRLPGTQLTLVCNSASFVHLLPVDVCARALLTLAPLTHTSDTHAFTVADANPLTYAEMAPILSQVFNIRITPTNTITGPQTAADRLFRKLTAQNHIFSQQSFHFSNEQAARLIGRAACSNWPKSVDFFSLLRSQYRLFVDHYKSSWRHIPRQLSGDGPRRARR
jgi:nucleoside-diphosphate-sugar epimerase